MELEQKVLKMFIAEYRTKLVEREIEIKVMEPDNENELNIIDGE